MVTYDNVKFTKGTDIVVVGAYNVEENILNTLKVIATPTTDSTPDVPKILNLNRVENRFTISGYLIHGKLDSSETKTSAVDKKILLRVCLLRVALLH